MKTSNFRLLNFLNFQKPVILLFTILFLQLSVTKAQTFTESGISLFGIRYGNATWGDYDNDGDLDISICGQHNGASSGLYTNNLGVSFTYSDEVTDLVYANLSWADYDNDGDIDMLALGELSGLNAKLLINNGDNTFTETSDHAIEGAKNAKTDWGDYDNDGDLDLILSGVFDEDNDSCNIKIYKNIEGNFTEIDILGIAQVGNGNVEWGDYDNDGDLDILVSGAPIANSNTNFVCTIYKNENNELFVEDTDNSVIGINEGCSTWGDYDNDGDLDILLCGRSSEGLITRVYKNDNGIYTQNSSVFTGLQDSECKWADLNNDGYLDIVTIGASATYYASSKTRIYINNNDDTFSELVGAISEGVYMGSIEPGDFDNDGDLDLLISGHNQYNDETTKIYVNNSTIANTAPSTPILSSVEFDLSNVTLKWNHSSDTESTTEALSYDIYLNSLSNTSTYTNANYPDGTRKTINYGHIQDTSKTMNLLPGNYTWSAQAIDMSYAGSSFSTIEAFTLPGNIIQPDDDQNAHIGIPTGLFHVEEYPLATSRVWKYSNTSGSDYQEFSPSMTSAFVNFTFDEAGVFYIICESIIDGTTYVSNEVQINVSPYIEVNASLLSTADNAVWGDLDNDDDLDIINRCSIIDNNGNDNFTVNDISLPNLQKGNADWGDFDNDGDLDLIITGGFGSTTSAATSPRIYKNTGDTNFELLNNTQFEERTFSTAKWVDYDNDGDLDIIIVGMSDSYSDDYKTDIYENIGNSQFSLETRYSLPDIGNGDFETGDYDNDGDLDIIISGIGTDDNPVTLLLKNNLADHTFEEIPTPFANVYECDINMVDYDNDGDLDVYINGSTSYTTQTSNLYKNEGSDVFTIVSGNNFPNLKLGSNDWGDYDNDGDKDLLITGYVYYTEEIITTIYQNNGSDLFEPMENHGIIDNYFNGDGTFGDYDNDGDLDIIICGYRFVDANVSSLASTNIYKNLIVDSNNKPDAPTNLQSSIVNDTTVTLSWDASIDVETNSEGLNYSLYLINDESGIKYYTSMANITSGKRLLSEKGKIQSTSHTVNLPLGDYTWKAQAIDSNNEGSEFSVDAYFSVLGCRISPDTILYTHIGGPTQTIDVVEHTDASSRTWKYSTVSGGAYIPFEINQNGATVNAVFNEDGIYYLICESVIEGNTYISNEITVYVSPFNESSTVLFSGSTYGDIDAGDYDNDGDLDILFSGARNTAYPYADFTEVYKNTSAQFTEQTAISIPGVFGYDSDWVDFDNDGDLDIIATGRYFLTSYRTLVYLNDGTGSFNSTTITGLPTPGSGKFDWGDYDKDGDMDALYSLASSGHVKVYKNNGDYSFTESVIIAEYSSSGSKWLDYDNDGDLDVITSIYNSEYLTKIYKNLGNDFFTEQTFITLTGVRNEPIFGDYDNDGDLDLFLYGLSDDGNKAIIYKNLGSEVFQELTDLDLTGFYNAKAEWGDYDNDGDLDLFVSGTTTNDITGSKTILIKNMGNDIFVEKIEANLHPFHNGCFTLLDYDNDNDLDVILSGNTGDTESAYLETRVYENLTNTPNTNPYPPENLETTIGVNTVDFAWTSGLDDETPDLGLNYNLYIKNLSTDELVYCTKASFPDGYRRTCEKGLIQNTLQTITLPDGNYIWSVQSVDPSFAGSEFANAQTFSKPIGTGNTITFHITDSDNSSDIENAEVVFNGQNTLTDALGLAVFSDVLTIDNMPYSISHPDYNNTSGELNITADETIDIELTHITYTATFIVSDINGIIEDADVNLNATNTLTNDQGTAVFQDLSNGIDFPYSVVKSGHETVNGILNLIGDTVIEISMTIVPPPVITQNTENSSICVGESTSFIVEATEGTIQYQWQLFETSDFIDIVNSSIYADSGTGTLLVSNTTHSMSGNQYRCKISNSANTIYSDIAILYVDEIAPVPSLTEIPTLESPCEINITDIPTATDECEGEIQGTTSDNLFYDQSGTYTITWTFDDGNGNTSTQTQSVIVSDEEAPIPDLSTLPDITDECSITPDSPTATDNCNGEIVGTTSTQFPISAQGTNIVSWSFDDGNGNISEQNQNIIITDNINPVISCIGNQTITLTSPSIVYTVVETEFAPLTISDNCTNYTIENDYNNSTSLANAEFTPGIYTITWTVSDNAGNTSECSFDLTVNGPSGINSAINEDFNIYPNPTSDKINIKFTKDNIEFATVLVINVDGKTIENKTLTHSNDMETIIDLSKYPSGIYLLKIITNDNIYIERIVKN